MPFRRVNKKTPPQKKGESEEANGKNERFGHRFAKWDTPIQPPDFPSAKDHASAPKTQKARSNSPQVFNRAVNHALASLAFLPVWAFILPQEKHAANYLQPVPSTQAFLQVSISNVVA